MSKRIAVMVIDDSAVVRQVLGSLMRDTPGFELIGAHSDPVFAQRAMQARWPDVIVLDVEMPRMDGITFLRKVMAEHPDAGGDLLDVDRARRADHAVGALAAGAVAIVDQAQASACVTSCTGRRAADQHHQDVVRVAVRAR
jgi:two-component system chemotaxis response regulator CheB